MAARREGDKVFVNIEGVKDGKTEELEADCLLGWAHDMFSRFFFHQILHNICFDFPQNWGKNYFFGQ